MKKVKYAGQIDGVILMLDGNPTVVNKDDVVEVPDNFSNANFEDYVEPAPVKQEKESTTKTKK